MKIFFKSPFFKNYISNVFMMVFFFLVSIFQFLQISAEVYYVKFDDVFDASLSTDAIIRNEVGFENDFLIVHSLIRQYRPANLFEIGTCQGKGTMIIKNAIMSGEVYSLELPPGAGPYALTREDIGANCSLPFIQLLGDSMNYDYTKNFPIVSWFIDGWHDYEHVYYETNQALLSNPILIMWHDTDIPEVFQAVIDAMGSKNQYDIYRITDTRMSYAVKK